MRTIAALRAARAREITSAEKRIGEQRERGESSKAARGRA